MDTGQDAIGKHIIYYADAARTEITAVGRDASASGRDGSQIDEPKYLAQSKAQQGVELHTENKTLQGHHQNELRA
jgi:hypothetical protein